jgi:sulfite dehydrogenase (cytochrome) subunit B
MRRLLFTFAILISTITFFLARDRASSGSVSSIDLPAVHTELAPGEHKANVESFCSICHSLDYISMQPQLSEGQWTAIVNKMVKVFGAPINEADAGLITQYLTTHYGTK